MRRTLERCSGADGEQQPEETSDDQVLHLSFRSFVGRGPRLAASASSTYVNSSPLSTHLSIRPPLLISPRPTNSVGKRSLSSKASPRMPRYFDVATLPRNTT